MILDLPRDLAEEVLCKLPLTCLRQVRLSCRKLNTLSKSRKKKKKEFHVVMVLENKVYLMNVNLLLLLPSPSIEPIGKLVGLDKIQISEIFHCDGLLLCVIKEDLNNLTCCCCCCCSSRLLVLNPFLGQTRWIKPRSSYHIWDRYALGYDKSILRSHKILRFVDELEWRSKPKIFEFEIYNLNSNSWKVLDDVTPDWDIRFYRRGLSLEGNTYWYATERIKQNGPIPNLPGFLVCFDFTTERFGPHLPLPFPSFFTETVTLSSVGQNQLAVLFQEYRSPYTMQIWISNRIEEPNALSWSNLFLEVDMEPLVGFQFPYRAGSFFVDQEKKLVVVLDKDQERSKPTRNIAYIIGKRGYFKQVVLGESRDAFCDPLTCSYVPSSVQI